MPTISTLIPNQLLDRSTFEIPRNLKLADPGFHVSAPIDVLLSSGSTLESMCVGQLNLTKPDEPKLRPQKTRFGWVIGGSPTSQAATNIFHATTTEIQADLARFWEIDEGPPIIHLSESELRCEKHFQSHVQRTKEWRYIAALPFNEKHFSVGSSKAAAMSRLASLYRRFQRDKSDHPPSNRYYLPHHGVIKESSDTTKLRVVFDGSESSTTGVSLSDTLHTEPKLQED